MRAKKWRKPCKWKCFEMDITYVYVSSLTLIRPAAPVVSVRLVKFTVFPNRQYLGIRFPITPVTTSPEWMPIVIFYIFVNSPLTKKKTKHILKIVFTFNFWQSHLKKRKYKLWRKKNNRSIRMTLNIFYTHTSLHILFKK